MSKTYNMSTLGLFGKRCRIKHVSNMKEGFVYRIVQDGILSNVWKELPFGRIPHENVVHNHSEEILIVVCDTLIDDDSKLERVRLKDVEIMNEMQNGCKGCAFENVTGWGFPCCNCSRNYKDYWRSKSKE